MLASLLQAVLRDYHSARLHSAFAGHEMGDIVRKQIPNAIARETDLPDHYIVKGSVGQGTWATVPWIAIMDKRITATTQTGVYIVFLFSEDGSKLCLTLSKAAQHLLRCTAIRMPSCSFGTLQRAFKRN